jgi:hypothetical protein
MSYECHFFSPCIRKLVGKPLICYRPRPASCYSYWELVHISNIVIETRCYVEQSIKSQQDLDVKDFHYSMRK